MFSDLINLPDVYAGSIPSFSLFSSTYVVSLKIRGLGARKQYLSAFGRC